MLDHVGAVGSVLRRLPIFRGKARCGRALAPRSLRQRPTTIHTGDGVFRVPNTLEPIAFDLWLNGAYEPEVIAYLRSASSPTSMVIDVGANIGAVTIPLARYLSAGRVVSVEASPHICELLRLNIAANHLSNVTVVPCAASDDSAPIEFHEAPIEHFGMGSRAPQFDAVPTSVPAMTLDAIVEQSGARDVSAIKVDVEGYEAHVFLGGSNLLQSPAAPHVVFEFMDWAEERAFPNRRGLAQQILMSFGYRIWRLRDFGTRQPALARPVVHGAEMLIGIPP